MRKRFPDFKSYSDITMETLLQNNELADAGHLKADHMSTTCFMSGPGGKLTPVPLPEQAQYSPVYAIEVSDFNDDGHIDLLLGGNNSFSKLRLGMMDSGYGTLLQGNGKGGFVYVDQTRSGLDIRGDVRSSVRINDKILFGICGGEVKCYAANAGRDNVNRKTSFLKVG